MQVDRAGRGWRKLFRQGAISNQPTANGATETATCTTRSGVPAMINPYPMMQELLSKMQGVSVTTTTNLCVSPSRAAVPYFTGADRLL